MYNRAIEKINGSTDGLMSLKRAKLKRQPQGGPGLSDMIVEVGKEPAKAGIKLRCQGQQECFILDGGQSKSLSTVVQRQIDALPQSRFHDG